MVTVESYIKKSSLYSKDKKIALYRGGHNPEYLFIGGMVEKGDNAIGIPFSSREGNIIDQWIKECKIEKAGILSSFPLIKLNKGGIRVKPTIDEINFFTPILKVSIENFRTVKVLIVMGELATYMLYKKKLNNLLGSELYENGRYVFFVNEPLFYIRRANNGVETFSTFFKKRIAKI